MTDDDGSALEAHHALEHAEEDEHGGGHGHGADPNAGVHVGTPPTPAWIMAAVVIGLVTIIASVLVAVALQDVESAPAPGPHPTEQSEH